MLSLTPVRVALVVLVVIPTRPSAAEELRARPSTPIALPDVLQVALRQNPTLTRAVIDIDLARADMLAAEGLDDFTLTAVGSIVRTQRWVTLGPPTGDVVTDVAQAQVGLARNLATGGQISGTASTNWTGETFHPDGMDAYRTFSGNVTELSARAMQPILRGYGKRIARAPVRRAAIARDIATLQQTVEALSVVRNAIVAYWQVGYALEIVQIRRIALNLASEQLAITARAVRSGSVSPTETLAAEQVIALRELALLQAEVDLSKQSLDLRRLVGLELGRDQIDLAPSTPLATPVATYDIDVTLAQALGESPLLAFLEAQGRAADVEVDVTSDPIRPRLDVFATLTSTGRSAEVSDALRQLGTIANPTFALVLEYEQQIGGRAAKGAHERAKAQRRRARIDIEEARREVIVSISHAIDLMRTAQKRIAVGVRAISLAKRNLEIEQTRFVNGKATNFDVLLRQDELQQASVARALAITDALAAEATVEALTGGLLERHHITIAPR